MTGRRAGRTLAAAASAAVLGLALAGNAFAAVIDVTTTADESSAGDGCSLREAVAAANSDGTGPGGDCSQGAGSDTINVPASVGHYVLDGAGGELSLSSDLTIQGSGGANTVIDGGGTHRVFEIAAGAHAELRDLTVTGGRTATPAPKGPGPDNSGTPGAESVGPHGDTAPNGGGILSAGTLALVGVTVTGNATGNGGDAGPGGVPGSAGGAAGGNSIGGNGGNSGHGGGVAATAGSLSVVDSTISANSTGHGGAGGDGGTGGAGDPGTTQGLNGGWSRGAAGGTSGEGGGVWADTGVAVSVSGSVIADNTIGAGGRGGDAGSGGAGGAGALGSGGNGGLSIGGDGTIAGGGGGINTVDDATISATTIRDNRSGAGGPGGDGGQGGDGGSGDSPAHAGSGGDSHGGGGGIGGAAGGLLLSGNTSSIRESTINGNAAGDGGRGGDGGIGGSGVGAGGRSYGGFGGFGGFGGGVWLLSSSSSSVTNSTIASNHAGAGGPGGAGGAGPSASSAGSGRRGGSDGGILVLGPVDTSVTHATIAFNGVGAGGAPGDLGTATSGNQAGTPGVSGQYGGIENAAVTVTLRNSIIASNGGATNCGGHFSPDSSGNVVFPVSDTSCPAEIAADPLLGPLVDNGGPTATMALGPGSPALDAMTSNCSATDQRGIARPKGSACDSGAFERAVPVAVTETPSSVSLTAATLAATVNPSERPTAYVFDYGKTAAYGSRTSIASAGADGADAPIAVKLSGLEPATTYHNRVAAINGDGLSIGADRTLRTLDDPFDGVSIPRQVVRPLQRSTVVVHVVCPGTAAGGCSGDLKLAVGRGTKTVVLGPVHFTVARGRAAGVRVKLAKSLGKALAKEHKLKATASTVARDRYGTTRHRVGSVIVKLPKKSSPRA